MVYSKTKKVNACNKLLQTFLKKYGYYKASVDGWYGNETKKAVLAFQNKFKKKYGLKPNGKMDAKTFRVMNTIEVRQNSTILSATTQCAKSAVKKTFKK